uniref:Putative ABC-transporter permease n=1 Tax=uncultured bacterium fosmid pJB77G10 TaxID=1478069 RepID=A0A0H3U825_9BACT|nr:putative ABC-transporter permease [uncultured bacterium fosmid pJB77G10]
MANNSNVIINQPKTRGVARVPVVMQLEQLECGAACLAMVLAYYKKWIPLEQLRTDCGVSRDGSKAGNLLRAARAHGLNAKGYKYEPNSLRTKATFPCIVHWNFNHFVVLDGIRGNKVYINDPAKGPYTVSWETFDESYTGICLMFEPGEDFVPSGKQKSVFAFVKKRLSGLLAPLVLTLITSMISSTISLFTLGFNRVFYDRLLSGKNPEWGTAFLLGLLVLYLFQIITTAFTTVANLRINGKMNIDGNLSYMWKVLHLPVKFFSQRSTGDISSRQGGNATISNTIVQTIAPIFINVVMMFVYLFAMINFSPFLTAIALTASLINLVLSNVFVQQRIKYARVQTRDEGKLSAATVAGIQMIETIKASGAEEGYFGKWSGYFAALNASSQKMVKKEQIYTTIPQVVSTLASTAIVGIGVYFTMKGQFTLGSITTFQGFYSYFTTPARSLLSSGEKVQSARVAMERIEDVMEYPDDPNVVEIIPEEGTIEHKLSGNIEIKNISFGYSPLDEPLIKDLSINITPGKRIAFVGPSGCGKSTLSKLITGLYVPWSGDILFDGKHINEIDHTVFTSSVGIVDQDITLFRDTVENNIKMWDDSIDEDVVTAASIDAQIHNDILARTDGYQSKLTEGGKDFSGGQRQRLEIARTLAQEPTILIMDEATSALDAQTEYEVMKSIKNRNITCILIAHRLSTIRDCDEILVLQQGQVVERGIHSELMELKGYYYDLVQND